MDKSLIVITAKVQAGREEEMKNILIVCLMVLFFVAGGCAKRIEIVTIEKERIDQDLTSGNKGFLQGTPPPVDETKRATTREIYQVTVDLPPYPEWEKFRVKDKELWGNRGYVYGEKKEAPSFRPETEPAIALPEEETKVFAPEVTVRGTVPEEKAYTVYVVKQGDTLGKIAKEIYGKASKWQIIYEANKENIKNPNKIYPGQKLKIPQP